MGWIQELKRRNVFRVGAAYVLLGWVIIQVTDTVTPALNLPDWTLTFVTWLGIIGLPFALFFAWAFELTPDGVRRDAGDSPGGNSSSTHALDITLVVLLLVTIALISWNAYVKKAEPDTASGNEVAITESGTDADTSSLAIAVLPLVNMSADSNNAYFAGGVHEEILTNLTAIDGLHVTSRTTAIRYMDSPLSLQEIGRELDVRYIVEGSVRRVNDHVRVTVQLIDAATDTHLWASNYDRELIDVFAVQSEVAKAITDSLHLEIQPETVGTLDGMPTRSVKAYDLYMKAMSIERSEPESEDSLQRQRDLLEAAVAEDPGYVEAWASLNEILDFMARNILQNDWFGDTQDERDTRFEEIRAAAQRSLDMAVRLDPNNVMSLLAQASDYVREQESQEFQVARKQYIDRALEIEPDNAVAWLVLGWWYRLEGRVGEATPAFRRALELDPLHARIVDSSLIHFRLIGDQETTTLLFERLAQLAPEKAEDETLGEVHPLAKLDNLAVVFSQTVDESLIDDLAAELAKYERYRSDDGKIDPDLVEARRRIEMSRLYQMRGDLESLLEQERMAPPANPSDLVSFVYLRSQGEYIAAQRLRNNTDGIVSAAEAMVNIFEPLEESGGSIARAAKFQMAVAYDVLGDDTAAGSLRETLEALDSDRLFDYMSGPFLAYSIIDPDESIDLVLERKHEHPSWFGTDWIAMLHVTNRHLLVRPRMQAFYVEEGKWLDYLAERVPEYARYRE